MVWFWIFLIVYIVTIMVLYGFYKEENSELESEINKLKEQLENKRLSQGSIVEKPVEKTVYKDRIVEKKVEVPVEKIVYVDKPVEKIVEKEIKVEVEKIVYVEKDKSNGAVVCLDDIKEQGDRILENAHDTAERIIREAKDKLRDAKKEADKLLEEHLEQSIEVEDLKKELEHQIRDNQDRMIKMLQSYCDVNLIKDDRFLGSYKRSLKFLESTHETQSNLDNFREWRIKAGSSISDYTLKRLLFIVTLYADSIINNLAVNVYKKGLYTTLHNVSDTISNIEKLVPGELNYKFPNSYIERSMDKIKTIYEIEEYKERKKEEQRILKEQQREEAAAQREFERELKRAQKDQQKAEEALQKAREEAEKEKQDSEKFLKLQEQIASLQSALEEAQQHSERVMSMAQQTRQGWVYIISNVGSFGENVYKIGMTRRLDPMERVNELGDASVPFPFDVHALIFSDDAPALETALHQAFEPNKTNLINGKKEFFNVSLEDIKQKVNDLGYKVDFEDKATASQYRDTLYARKSI